ncbi:MAG: benzoyl-CoA reductase subunit C [Deltaproteobacteria bacterium]|nr:MAG: benzoyl-CoA reductase subunit C [Deltaproteobacteria bacterium]
MTTERPRTRADIVDTARRLYEDLEFTAVREWLAADPDRKAVGCLPVYVPREVVWAAGVLPVGIHGGGDRLEIIRGDAYYQSYICHLPRSVVELGLSGRLDMLSGMLFPSTCDVIRNLSGMWQILRPEVYVRYVDVPQVEHPATGLEFWKGELSTIYRDMCAIAGTEPSDEALWAAIDDYDRVRDVIGRLYALRRDEPWKVPTEELYLVMRAGEVLPPPDFVDLATAYLEACHAEPLRRRDNTRVIVVGSFCEQPPLGLIKTIERAGCYIVGDDFLLGNRMITRPPERGGDPVEALAHALLFHHQPSSVMYEPDPDAKEVTIKKMVDAARADGVIFAAASFCDPALLDRPMLRAGAEAHGIPCIAFKFSENTGQFQQFREQAGTFSDSIKLWGGA